MILAPILFFSQVMLMPGPYPGLNAMKVTLAVLTTLLFYLFEFTQNTPRWNITATELIFILIVPPVIFTLTWLLVCPASSDQRANVLWITLVGSIASYLIELVIVPCIRIKEPGH